MRRVHSKSTRANRKRSIGGFGKKLGGRFGSSLGSRFGRKLGRKIGGSYGKNLAEKYLPMLFLRLAGAFFPGLPIFSKKTSLEKQSESKVQK